MTRHRLSTGIQSFRRLRETNCYYVDKTLFIHDLTDWAIAGYCPDQGGSARACCLIQSEPCLKDTSRCSSGWTSTGTGTGSLRLIPCFAKVFGGKYNEPEDIERNVLVQLEAAERNAGLPPSTSTSGHERLLDLLDRLHRATDRQVVVLVDEYDKPILDVLHDPELATADRDYLRGSTVS